MTPAEANALINTHMSAVDALVAFIHNYRGVTDILGDSTYQQLVTDRDAARDALVAAMVGGGS